MMDQILTDSFEQLILEQCDPARIRRIEAGEPTESLWALLHESGFMDALVPEDRGGAGLGLRDVADLFIACGRHALPVPVAHTALARAELSLAGIEPPSGSITLADRCRVDESGTIVASAVPFGLTADWVWARISNDSVSLLPTGEAERQLSGGHGSLAADLRWKSRPAAAISATGIVDSAFDLRSTGAAVNAALLAGAMARVLEMSIGYANERVQFGKPIGKFQAVQQQLSVLSEQTYASRTAALLGLSSITHRVDPRLAAIAKSRASEAAVVAAAIGHAVHGAIGITAEYDLQLYTRPLHEWRREYGGETYWNSLLGRQLLAAAEAPLEFVRLLCTRENDSTTMRTP